MWSIETRGRADPKWRLTWMATGENAERDTRARFEALRAGFAGEDRDVHVHPTWVAARLMQEDTTVTEIERTFDPEDTDRTIQRSTRSRR